MAELSLKHLKCTMPVSLDGYVLDETIEDYAVTLNGDMVWPVDGDGYRSLAEAQEAARAFPGSKIEKVMVLVKRQ